MTTAAPAKRAPTPPIDLGQISLRAAPGKAERGLVIGGTDAGKSTLAEMLARDFLDRYRPRSGRRLILDSKPRYQAQFLVNGMSAKRRYRGWDHGAYVPGSVVVDEPRDLKTAWQMGARTVIVQCESSREIGRLVTVARAFLDDSRTNRPQLLQVDETLDFFHGNGIARGGDDVLERSARAGRERGTAGLYCSQRTRGMSVAFLSEMTRLYAMVLDAKADAKRFQEFGAPEFTPPEDPHLFYYWTKHDRRRVWGPYRLNLRGK